MSVFVKFAYVDADVKVKFRNKGLVRSLVTVSLCITFSWRKIMLIYL